MSKEFRLGLFVIATLAVLAAGTFLIGRKETLFASNYTVRAEFQNVAGLNEGGEVRVGGIHEGTVKSIHLPKGADQKVAVVLDLKRETRNVVKQDSVAAIRSEGLLGDKYVEVSFGSENAKPLRAGETIATQPPLDISDLIDKTNQILDKTKDAVQNVDTTGSHLASITSKVDQGRGTVGALINDKSVFNETKAAVTSLHEDTEALKHNFLLRGFFKNRGYEDTDQLAKYAIRSLPPGTPIQRFTYSGRQIFDKSDSAKLKNTKQLNDAGQVLESEPFGIAVVTVSTGMKGDAGKERVISEARANAVREYLADKFRIEDTNKLKTMGLGKSGEAGDGGSVEILIYPAGPHETASRNP